MTSTVESETSVQVISNVCQRACQFISIFKLVRKCWEYRKFASIIQWINKEINEQLVKGVPLSTDGNRVEIYTNINIKATLIYNFH